MKKSEKPEIPKEIEDLANDLSGSYWNYRWIKVTVDIPKIDDNLELVEGEIGQEVYYELHEVYYDKEEKPFMWSKETEKLCVENVDEMMELIAKEMEASVKKVLIIENNEIRELNEYMPKSEFLKNKIKEIRNEKKTRRKQS